MTVHKVICAHVAHETHNAPHMSYTYKQALHTNVHTWLIDLSMTFLNHPPRAPAPWVCATVPPRPLTTVKVSASALTDDTSIVSLFTTIRLPAEIPAVSAPVTESVVSEMAQAADSVKE